MENRVEAHPSWVGMALSMSGKRGVICISQRYACNPGRISFHSHFHCSVGFLGSKLFPEVISAIFNRYMILTTSTN